jgi:hypothetical protein
MILQELFESSMKRVLDDMREIKTLTDDEFLKIHGMSKAIWVKTHWPVIKSVAQDDAEITKYLPAADAHLFHEENQDDRNARIIAGEIEDAMSQGNEKVAQEKIKQLIRVGYTLDKQGKLQRMGMYEESELQEEQDACYRKVKSRYKVWPSAYASGALVQCRKKGAANWGNKTKK